MVNDLLDLSKIEAGRYDLIEERVNLAELVRVCQRMIGRGGWRTQRRSRARARTGWPSALLFRCRHAAKVGITIS
jgi:hypothetical protein